jgi:hypothetical protein
MKKIISIVVCAVFAFVALAGMAMAQAKPAAPAAAPAKPAAPAAAPAPAPAAAPAPAPAPAAKDITGTVEKGKMGMMLKAADGEYMCAGMDLSKMVGKKVVATGTVAEKDGKKTLTVTAVKEAK